MAESPSSLEEIILDLISSNLISVCNLHKEDQDLILCFKDKEAFFHQKLANKLLVWLDKKEKLDDLNLSLFQHDVLRLSQVQIHNGKNLTLRGLKALRNHRLTSVTVRGLFRASVNDLISCFNDWTLNNITNLNINGTVFTQPYGSCSSLGSSEDINDTELRNFNTRERKHSANIVLYRSSIGQPYDDDFSSGSTSYFSSIRSLPNIYISLCKLRNLQVLDISKTEIVSHALSNICTSLIHLASLDISFCSRLESIDCLRIRKNTLKSLSMHNLKLINIGEAKDILLELNQLVHLDISESINQHMPVDRRKTISCNICDLISQPNFVPQLQSLDISGHVDLEAKDIITFLDNHKNVMFLGLMFTFAVSDPLLDSLDIGIITGHNKPEHLIEGLKRYSLRKNYVPKILYNIFGLTSDFETPQPELIKVIVSVINQHKLELSIQLAGTACLYYLTRGQTGEKIHPKILQSVVNATLTAMNNFPKHSQLQKKSLLILCTDRMLHDVNFDKYWCAKLVLDCLLTFDDVTTNKMAVAICSILAAKLSTSQTALLGASTLYMKKLLQLVNEKMEVKLVDITLKFTLSALWNLTDESPATCEVFLAENGLNLLMSLLKVFPNELAVETKVLGLLNNIAEVSPLRPSLINQEFLVQLRILLKSSHVDVSYFAAGIVSHLMCASPESWSNCEISQTDLLMDLQTSVLGWKQPKEEMVAYRSFEPFVPLLMCQEKYPVQLWAVWALHHVTIRNSKRYCAMLVLEGVGGILRRLSSPNHSHPEVQNLASKVIDILSENGFQIGVDS